MSPPSLLDLARKACIKHVHAIWDVGDAEYALVRPVLLKLQNPEQLLAIEKKCSQIRGVDAEIWIEFCKRDIPGYDKDPKEPTNPESWFKLYDKLRRENERRVEEDAKQLKATMDGIKAKQANNVTQQVELRGVKLLAGMNKGLPQIQLPRNSSFYHKERPMHLDANILQYERENGAFPASDSHRYDTHKNNSEKATPKSSKLMQKFKKDALASTRVVRQAQPGLITSREMRAKQAPTRDSMLAAARVQGREHRVPAPPSNTLRTTPKPSSSTVDIKRHPISGAVRRPSFLPPSPKTKTSNLSTVPATAPANRKRSIEDADAGASNNSSIDRKEKHVKMSSATSVDHPAPSSKAAIETAKASSTKSTAGHFSNSTTNTLTPEKTSAVIDKQRSPSGSKTTSLNFGQQSPPSGNGLSPPISPVSRAHSRSPQAIAPMIRRRKRANSNPLVMPKSRKPALK